MHGIRKQKEKKNIYKSKNFPDFNLESFLIKIYLL